MNAPPVVGPVVRLTYRATVDVSRPLPEIQAGGAVFGLTCASIIGRVDWRAE